MADMNFNSGANIKIKFFLGAFRRDEIVLAFNGYINQISIEKPVSDKKCLN